MSDDTPNPDSHPERTEAVEPEASAEEVASEHRPSPEAGTGPQSPEPAGVPAGPAAPVSGSATQLYSRLAGGGSPAPPGAAVGAAHPSAAPPPVLTPVPWQPPAGPAVLPAAAPAPHAWSPAPEAPLEAPAPGALAAPGQGVEGADVWYWCPNHLIASERPGTCPSCGQPFQQAPPWGIPAGPYRPHQQAYQRTRKESVVFVTTGVVLTALVAGIALGLVLLYRHGTPLSSDGTPQTSPSAASASAGGSSASADTGANSAFAIKSLDNRTLVLQGSWQRLANVSTTMSDLAKAFTTDSSQPPSDLAIGHGKVAVAVFAITDPNPTTDVGNQTISQQDSKTVTGGTITFTTTTTRSIAGHSSLSGDLIGKDTTGKQVFDLRYYLVPTADHIVLIEVQTTGASTDLDPIDQAVKAI